MRRWTGARSGLPDDAPLDDVPRDIAVGDDAPNAMVDASACAPDRCPRAYLDNAFSARWFDHECAMPIAYACER